MKTVSNRFKLQDKIRCTEDIYSEVYKKLFRMNHEFWIKGVEKTGLVIEDAEGFLLKNVGFKTVE